MSTLTSTSALACFYHVISLKFSDLPQLSWAPRSAWQAGYSSLLEDPRQASEPPLTPTTSVSSTSQAPGDAEAKKPGVGLADSEVW